MTQQMFFAVKGGVLAFKVCEHKSDSTQLVIKARHPEVGVIVAQLAEADILDTDKGSAYFLTYVSRDQFFKGFGKVALDAFEGKVTILPPAFNDEATGPAVPVMGHLSMVEAEAENEDGDGPN